jgi:magnesium-transporting ATPase (P-type)
LKNCAHEQNNYQKGETVEMNELALNDEKMKLKKMRWFLFLSFWMIVATIFCCSNTPVFADIASSKMATQSKSFIKDTYLWIVGISSVAAALAIAIKKAIVMFASDDRSITDSRKFTKNILISWAVINGIGFFFTAIQPYLSGGSNFD